MHPPSWLLTTYVERADRCENYPRREIDGCCSSQGINIIIIGVELGWHEQTYASSQSGDAFYHTDHHM